jgi:D-glycero-alpha-D-manno-heptose-7-phosphate kinase
VEPIYLSPKIKDDFQNHLLLFYTGIQRSSSPILLEQRENINKKFEFLKKLSDLVPPFRNYLQLGDFQKMGEILHQNWLMKKELSSGISNPQIEEMYRAALAEGAYGGKVLGAGGGGFLLVMAPPENQLRIKEALKQYRLTPFRFSEAGSKIVFKD